MKTVFIVMAEEDGWNGSSNSWIVRVCSSIERARKVVEYNTKTPTLITYKIHEWTILT